MSVDFLGPFGDDLVLGGFSDFQPIGTPGLDFEFISGSVELIQRVVRRILTNKGEWIPFPTYGTHVRTSLHETITRSRALAIRGEIQAQILDEPDVALSPPPEITFDEQPHGQLIVSIRFYTKALELVSFNFKPRETLDISLQD